MQIFINTNGEDGLQDSPAIRQKINDILNDDFFESVGIDKNIITPPPLQIGNFDNPYGGMCETKEHGEWATGGERSIFIQFSQIPDHVGNADLHPYKSFKSLYLHEFSHWYTQQSHTAIFCAFLALLHRKYNQKNDIDDHDPINSNILNLKLYDFRQDDYLSAGEALDFALLTSQKFKDLPLNEALDNIKKAYQKRIAPPPQPQAKPSKFQMIIKELMGAFWQLSPLFIILGGGTILAKSIGFQ